MAHTPAAQISEAYGFPEATIRRYFAARRWREEHIETEPDTAYPDPTGNTAVANIMREQHNTRKPAGDRAPLRVGELAHAWPRRSS